MTLAECYDYAESHCISIYSVRFKKVIAMSIPDNIAIDYQKVKNSRHEKEIVIHELSHNETATYYGLRCPFQTVGRLEYRARKWSWTQQIPIDELIQAVSCGYCEIWELADYFDVPEEQIKEAITYYRDNGLI